MQFHAAERKKGKGKSIRIGYINHSNTHMRFNSSHDHAGNEITCKYFNENSESHLIYMKKKLKIIFFYKCVT